MAIDINNSQIGGINPNVNANVNVDSGSRTESANKALFNQISGIGSSLYQTYAPEAGKEAALKQYVNNLDKGANGDYSHISQFTPYGKAYNDTIDRIAPSILASNGEALINSFGKNILNDKSVPVSEKVSAFASQSKQSIIDYIKNIPPEHQADVAMLLARQANNSQNDLITKVAQKQAVDQQYQAMDSINKVTVLANSSSNINQSYDYYLQAKTMAEAGLDIGLTPEKVNSIIENAGASIFGKYNFKEINDYNDSLPEDKKLSPESIRKSVDFYNQQYNQQQNALEQAAIKAHWSHEQHLVELSHGIIRPVPNTLPESDRQITADNAALSRYNFSLTNSPEDIREENDHVIGGQLANNFKSLTPIQQYYLNSNDINSLAKSMPGEQWQVLRHSVEQFNKISPKAQNLTMNYLREYGNAVKYDPVKNLELEESAPAVIYKSQIDRGISPRMLTNEQSDNYAKEFMQSPSATISKIYSNYSNYAPLAIKEISKKTGMVGVNVADKNLQNEYLLGSTLPTSMSKLISIGSLTSNETSTLAQLPSDTHVYLNDLTSQLSKTRNQKGNDVMRDLFTFDNGNFLYKTDEYINSSSGRGKIVKLLNTRNAEDNFKFNDMKIQLDPINNLYHIYGNTESGLVKKYTLTKDEVDNIHAGTMVERLKGLLEHESKEKDANYPGFFNEHFLGGK